MFLYNYKLKMSIQSKRPKRVPKSFELAISIVDDKELTAYLADLDELNPRRYKIIAGSIASLFEHEIKIERGSHVRTAQIRVGPRPRNRFATRDVCYTLIYLKGLLFSLFEVTWRALVTLLVYIYFEGYGSRHPVSLCKWHYHTAIRITTHH